MRPAAQVHCGIGVDPAHAGSQHHASSPHMVQLERWNKGAHGCSPGGDLTAPGRAPPHLQEWLWNHGLLGTSSTCATPWTVQARAHSMTIGGGKMVSCSLWSTRCPAADAKQLLAQERHAPCKGRTAPLDCPAACTEATRRAAPPSLPTKHPRCHHRPHCSHAIGRDPNVAGLPLERAGCPSASRMNAVCWQEGQGRGNSCGPIA